MPVFVVYGISIRLGKYTRPCIIWRILLLTNCYKFRTEMISEYIYLVQLLL